MYRTIHEDYSKKIIALRSKLDLTQASLAEKLGVSLPTVNRWENGKVVPSQLAWDKIQRLLGNSKVEDNAVSCNADKGFQWVLNGPTTVLVETHDARPLTSQSVFKTQPVTISEYDILPDNIPDAWNDGKASVLSIATALSQKNGGNLPWKTVKDVITTALNAKFLELDVTSGSWPCNLLAARTVIFKTADWLDGNSKDSGNCKYIVRSTLKPSDIQKLSDVIPLILEFKTRTDTPICFSIEIEVGDSENVISDNTIEEFNEIIKNLTTNLKVQ